MDRSLHGLWNDAGSTGAWIQSKLALGYSSTEATARASEHGLGAGSAWWNDRVVAAPIVTKRPPELPPAAH
jgi:hypothetical protein